MNPNDKKNQKQKPYINPIETKLGSMPDAYARDLEVRKAQMEKQVAQEEQKDSTQGVANPEFKGVAFDFSVHSETRVKQEKIQEIQQVIEQIRAEVASIKRSSAGIDQEVERIEQATLGALPENVGIYHVRYYEILLSYLRGVREKVGEANTWLQAMQSKKAKRGSAFAAQSKKKGTSFSMSQELSAARNVQ